jgi:NAD(P)-dependent dehydrogenase (short-subunit alcohol dehydrogenase family)
MRERRSGLIVYVSSVVGRIVLPYSGIYTASKWALEALAETSAYELAPFGVDVAIVEPGAFATEIFGNVAGADDDERVRAYGEFAKAADERVAQVEASGAARDPHDVANAILRLAEAAPGTRPLRTVVPAQAGVDALNAAHAAVQQKALESFGLAALLPQAFV